MARPVKWNKEKKDNAIKLIFEGIYNGKSARSIIDNSNRDVIPTFFTFNEWLSNDNELSKQYARVCEMRFDLIFEEILNIADNVGQDIIITKDGQEIINHHIINRDRLRVDARKWALSKMNPKKYGDKLEVDSTNKNTIEYVNVSKQFKDKK